MSKAPLKLGAILYPGFEMLDYFGPLEMFSILGTDLLQIHTVAQQQGLVGAAIGAEGPTGPKVHAEYSFAEAPAFDVILLPGGFGTIPELDNPELMRYLQRCAAQATAVCSVCTGSALLAKAGLLDGRRATSNKQFFALAVAQSSAVTWVTQARWVEDGRFFTSSGVSAGMDMSLAVIAKLFGAEAAETVVKAAEYTWHRDSTQDPFDSELNAAAGQLTAG